jgi:hypothetical protein
MSLVFGPIATRRAAVIATQGAVAGRPGLRSRIPLPYTYLSPYSRAIRNASCISNMVAGWCAVAGPVMASTRCVVEVCNLRVRDRRPTLLL